MSDVSEKPVELTDEEFEAQLPKPVGYRLLVMLPSIDETYDGSSIVKVESEKHRETITSILGVVLDMGDQAYKDQDRFPTGPWCKVGDTVIFRMNTGTRIKVNGHEYRIMNDDSIEAVVADHRGITRA